MFIWVVRNENVKQAKILWTIRETCLNPKCPKELKKNGLFPRNRMRILPHGPTKWKVTQRNAWNDIANWRTEQLNSYTKSQRHALTTFSLKKKKWDLLENCQNFARKLFFKNACIWRALVDQAFLWSVNKLARVVTKWTRACDKRLARVISYTQYTIEIKQCCHVGNTAQQCRLGLFQDSDFAGDLEGLTNRPQVDFCAIFGSHTFVPISWMCKKQTSVSHSSTEAETNFLDAGSRMDGIPAVDLWDLVIKVFHSSTNQQRNPRIACRGTCCVTPHQTSTPKTGPRFQSSTTLLNCVMLSMFRRTRSLLNSMRCSIFFEDNEAVKKNIMKGRSPTMRHVSRTHRVALGWLFDRIYLDPKIQIKYVDTKHQLADVLTMGNFTRDEWNNLLHLFYISHFNLICSQNFSCLETMAKWMQEEEGEERIVAKSKPTLNLVSHAATSSSTLKPSNCVEKSGDTQGTLSS